MNQDMIIYIVQPGDTLNMIATRFNVTTRVILENNPIRNDLVIFPGQFLFIPRTNNRCFDDMYHNQWPFPPSDFPGDRRFAYYEVQRGDTLRIIASRFDTSVDAIVEANRLSGPNATIFPGQVLRIPTVGELFTIEE